MLIWMGFTFYSYLYEINLIGITFTSKDIAESVWKKRSP